ncbi:MAG: hypothetical protein PVJ57_13620 [Phycisphaerae bacterium]
MILAMLLSPVFGANCPAGRHALRAATPEALLISVMRGRCQTGRREFETRRVLVSGANNS